MFFPFLFNSKRTLLVNFGKNVGKMFLPKEKFIRKTWLKKPWRCFALNDLRLPFSMNREKTWWNGETRVSNPTFQRHVNSFILESSKTWKFLYKCCERMVTTHNLQRLFLAQYWKGVFFCDFCSSISVVDESTCIHTCLLNLTNKKQGHRWTSSVPICHKQRRICANTIVMAFQSEYNGLETGYNEGSWLEKKGTPKLDFQFLDLLSLRWFLGWMFS